MGADRKKDARLTLLYAIGLFSCEYLGITLALMVDGCSTL
jgi:hypothetical protein